MRTATILALLASSLTLPSVLALPVPQFAPQNTPQNDDLLKPISDAMNELLASNNGFGNGSRIRLLDDYWDISDVITGNKADGNASANKVGNGEFLDGDYIFSPTTDSALDLGAQEKY